MLRGWTKINILNWVLKVIFYFTVFFAKKQRNFPLRKYRWNELFKSSQALTFFLIPFTNLGLNVFPCGVAGVGGDNVLVSSQYVTHLRLPILKLILHSHNKIFRLCKSSETTYSFSNKIKSTFLTAKKPEKWTIFLVGLVMKNNGCQYCSAKWVLHNLLYQKILKNTECLQ